jgi:glycosyltransferase involved in cell wall biosynthesis
VNIYGLAPMNGGCHWYRIREPLRGLAGIGHTCDWGELFDERVVDTHDTILTHILHGEVETEAWSLLAEAGQHRLVYDIDDDIWAYREDTDHHEYWNADRKAQVETNIKNSWLITTPSEVIARKIQFELGLHDNVVVLPNYVPQWILDIPRTKPEKFVIGYQGAPQKLHQSDLDIISEELFWVLNRCKDAELHFFGQPKAPKGAGPFADRIKYTLWTPDVPAYYRSLHEMTVGIGPLHHNAFTAAKSAIRAEEFGALGIPCILSNEPPYRGWINHGENGYLVNYTELKEWRRLLIRLYNRLDLVEHMSFKARQQARAWTTEANAWKWEQAYEKCRARSTATPTAV